MEDFSELSRFFTNANVLITGATGFFGKMLIQKLLRSHNDIGDIYLLVRGKKGKSSEERMMIVLQDPVFDLLRQQRPDFMEKIHVIEGDTSLTKLGLNEETIKMLQEKINVIFHCAALLNMDAPLKKAVITNVKGTVELLSLCQNMKHLKSLVMVSTTYSNCKEPIIEEKFYEPNISADVLIKLIYDMEESNLNRITPGLIHGHPNTYSFTKNIAENVLQTYSNNIPVALFRPAIVTVTYSDPVSGWVDNINGPPGLGLGVLSGLIRVILMNDNRTFHLVPVDLCVNALICCAWDAKNRRSEDASIPVYNFSLGEKNDYTWGKLANCVFNQTEYRPEKAVWKPMVYRTASLYQYYILIFLLHTIPAFIADAVLFLLGKKTFVVKLYEKINKSIWLLGYFSTNEWVIKNDNVCQMWDKLSEGEKKVYNFDIRTVDFEKLVWNMIRGTKIYILKESVTDNKKANERYRKLLVLHYTLIGLLCCLFLWIGYILVSWW